MVSLKGPAEIALSFGIFPVYKTNSKINQLFFKLSAPVFMYSEWFKKLRSPCESFSITTYILNTFDQNLQ